GPPEHHVGHLGGRWPAEEVSLALVAAKAPQLRELLRRLDALGHRLEPERAAQADDGAHDRGISTVRGQARDERAVDLEHVDREALEIAQARVARAEVVDGEPDANR